MELYPLAQREAPYPGADHLPGRCQCGLDLQLVIETDQRFVDVAHERVGEAVVGRVRVHGQGVQVGRPGQRLTWRLRHAGLQAQACDQCHQGAGKELLLHDVSSWVGQCDRRLVSIRGIIVT